MDVRIVLYLSISISLSEALPTTAIDTGRSLHAEALRVTASEGPAQALHVAARAGFEPATLRSKGIDSTNEQPRPTRIHGWTNRRMNGWISGWMHEWMDIDIDKGKNGKTNGGRDSR